MCMFGVGCVYVFISSVFSTTQTCTEICAYNPSISEVNTGGSSLNRIAKNEYYCCGNK